MHDVAPVVSAGSDELEQSKQEESTNRSYREIREKQERVTMKWATMWRSIVLSSMGKTLLPYSQYIRTLNLNDIYDLLSDSKFLQARQISDAFFSGEMAAYRVDRSIKGSRKKTNYSIIDVEATVNKFAEVITQHTPMLEEFSGPNQPFDAETLARSIPRLANLQSLRIFHGEALEGIGSLLYKHCPLFHTLLIFGWQHPKADKHCASFLNEIRPQTLRSFQMLSTSTIGPETFLALNVHRESLSELELNDISADAMLALPMLKGCTSVNSLLLAERAPPTQDLEKRHNDVFLEVVEWLRECNDLHSLTVRNLLSAPALLTPILLENNIKLIRLAVENYTMSESKDFHQALAHQPSLQSLKLSGEGVEAGHSDNDILVGALSKLENLRDLELKEISDGFLNSHIIGIAQDLPKLEVLWTSGYNIGDEIWNDVAGLKSLRTLEINALTRFTADGISDFILSLGEGNKGMALVVNMQENDCDISDEDQATIRQTIDAKLEGRFGFQLWKGNFFHPCRRYGRMVY